MSTMLTDALCLGEKGLISIVGAGGKTSLMFLLANELAASGKSVLTTTTTKIFLPGPDQSPDLMIAGSFEALLQQSPKKMSRHHHFSAGSEIDTAAGKLNGFSPDIINRLHRAAVFDWLIVEADGARQKPLKATGIHEPVVPETTTHLILVSGLDAVGTILDDANVHRAALFSVNTGLSIGDTINEQSVATAISLEIMKAAAMTADSVNIVLLNKADTPERLTSGLKISRRLQSRTGISRIIITSLRNDSPVKHVLEIPNS